MLLCLAGMGAMMAAKAENKVVKAPKAQKEVYAEFVESTSTLTYYYDDQRTTRKGVTVLYDSENSSLFDEFKLKVTKGVVDASMKDANMTSTANMFARLSNMTSIEGLTNLNTKNVTDMTSMFELCYKLTSVNLSSFNTAKVEKMSRMFLYCQALTSLDLNSFSTISLTNTGSMFFYCSSLTTILCKNDWSKGKVSKSSDMFDGCTKLVGGNGTVYDWMKKDITYALPDGKDGKKGYFTRPKTEVTFYGVLGSDGKTLTIYYDDEKEDRGGAYPFPGGWQSTTTKVVFDESVKSYKPTSTQKMFYSFSKLESISHLDYLNTEDVTDMSQMFSHCTELGSVDVSHFDTKNVTNMSDMFVDCQHLKSIDVSKFDTKNVTQMSYMFYCCYWLTGLDLSHFDTQNVTNMSFMFYECHSLKSLDLSSFDTQYVTAMNSMFNACISLKELDLLTFNVQNVKSMDNMFNGCKALTTIRCNGDWSEGSVSSSKNMFFDCTSLVGGDGTTYDADKVDVEYARPDGKDSKKGYFTKVIVPFEVYSEFVEETGTLTFYYDDQIKSRTGKTRVYNEYSFFLCGYEDKVTKAVVDVSMSNATMTSMRNLFAYLENMTEIEGLNNLNTDAVKDMSYMFGYCDALTSLNLSSFNTENVTNMREMFYHCKSLTSLDLSSFNTDNVTEMFRIFEYCEALTSLNLSSFNTENVTNMSDMFYSCKSLISLDLSSFNTVNVTNMNSMFEHCEALTSLNLSSFNTENVTNMSEMFYYCKALTSLDLSSFNTGNVTNMSWMFYDCVALTSLNLSSFNTENVTNMSWMFKDCSALTSLDLTSFKTTNLKKTDDMFYGCSALTTIYCNEDWSEGAITNSEDMFLDCKALKGSQGTAYDAGKVDISYARPDGMNGKKGYFTRYEIYGVMDGTVMTLYYDTEIASRGGVSEWWNEYAIYTTVTKVILDESCEEMHPTSTSHWFSLFAELDTIVGLEHLHTEEVTDMSNMFSGCKKLAELDLSTFNTEKVTNMNSLFDGCASLEDLDLSSFNTANVTDMGYMFSGCTWLKTLNLGENFHTGEVTTFSDMFRDCSGLSAIPGVESFDTKKMKYAFGVFAGCSSLSMLDLSQWETPEMTYTENMFADCWSLVLLNISKFDMSKVTNASKMFAGGTSLKYIIHDGDWSDYAGLISSTDIFEDCISLTGEKGSAFSVLCPKETESLSLCAGRVWARLDGGEGDEGYFSKSVPELYAVVSDEGQTLTVYYDTKKEENGGLILGSEDINRKKVTKVAFDASVSDARPTSTKDWFNDFEAVEEFENLYYLNTEAVTDMSYMFYNCSSLKTLDLGNFKTRNVKNMFGMFAECKSLTNVTLYNFDTRNVEDMSYLFADCISLTNLDLYNFYTSKVKDMKGMFYSCSSLTSLGINKFDTHNVTDMSYMFIYCSSLVGLDISSFDMSNVSNVAYMFAGCSSLAYIVHSGDWSKKDLKPSCSNLVFADCYELRGENGTTYDESFVGIELARPDGGKVSPGYFSTSVPECYAVPGDGNKTLTLYFDTKIKERGGLSFWMDETYRNNVTKIVLDESMVSYRPGDLSFWFSGFKALKEIEHLDYLNTSQTVQFVSMFEGCEALESFDISHFDTRNVNGMSAMFKDCKAIKELHLAHFDTRYANSYSNMFQGCTSLEVVDIRPFSKPQDAYINEMFAGCTALKTIYWYVDWTDVEDYYATDMFKDCTALTGDHKTAYDDGHIDNSWARLDEGEGKEGYFSLFDGQEPYTMYDEAQKTLTYYNDNRRFLREGVLDDCFERKHFEVYKEELTKVVFTPEFLSVTPASTKGWFYDCKKLESIEGIEYLNTENVTDMSYMFANCFVLTKLDLSHFNTSNVTNMALMVEACWALTELDLTSFDMKNVTNTTQMFANDKELLTIRCNEDWSQMEQITQSEYMFWGCEKLVGGKGTVFDEKKASDKTLARPDGGEENPGYFTCQTFTVTFLDKDGNPIGEPQTVNIGQAAVAPTAPEVEGFTFTGWDKAFDNVTEDLTVQALYEAVELYTLTVKVEPAEGGTYTVTGLDEKQQGAFFAEFTITATPNEGYELVGWKDGDEMLDNKTTTLDCVLYGDMTITILFKKKTGTGMESILIPDGERLFQHSDVSIQKVLRDGVIYIERGGKMYDLNGRLVK